LVRELAEEIGIFPTTYEGLGEIIDRSPAARGAATYHMFAVTAWTGGPPAMRDREHTRLDWFEIEQACALANLALPEYRALFRRIPQS
jgi:8-oxo-dGTP diphosphatase